MEKTIFVRFDSQDSKNGNGKYNRNWYMIYFCKIKWKNNQSMRYIALRNISMRCVCDANPKISILAWPYSSFFMSNASFCGFPVLQFCLCQSKVFVGLKCQPIGKSSDMNLYWNPSWVSIYSNDAQIGSTPDHVSALPKNPQFICSIASFFLTTTPMLDKFLFVKMRCHITCKIESNAMFVMLVF